jgi:hypothetical protein
VGEPEIEPLVEELCDYCGDSLDNHDECESCGGCTEGECFCDEEEEEL